MRVFLFYTFNFKKKSRDHDSSSISIALRSKQRLHHFPTSPTGKTGLPFSLISFYSRFQNSRKRKKKKRKEINRKYDLFRQHFNANPSSIIAVENNSDSLGRVSRPSIRHISLRTYPEYSNRQGFHRNESGSSMSFIRYFASFTDIPRTCLCKTNVCMGVIDRDGSDFTRE